MVLAAGSASRFGSTKALAELDGRPLLLHAVDAAGAAGIGRVLVVVGHDADNVAAVVADRDDVEVVRNPDHATGQASSVRAGLVALQDDPAVHVALMLLADQPGISAASIRQVVSALKDGPDAARAQYHDRAGHPVALHRRVWPKVVAEVEGDTGARDVLGRLQVAHVLVPGSSPPDIDTPEDLTRLAGDPGDR
jgi:CTP:molybdopterin cytidylyltransferase MocA